MGKSHQSLGDLQSCAGDDEGRIHSYHPGPPSHIKPMSGLAYVVIQLVHAGEQLGHRLVVPNLILQALDSGCSAEKGHKEERLYNRNGSPRHRELRLVPWAPAVASALRVCIAKSGKVGGNGLQAAVRDRPRVA